MTGPLSAVLSAVASGVGTTAEISERTGLGRDTVSAAIDHLVRTERLTAGELALGCPSGGCGTCASAVEGAPGCGASAPSPTRTGRALVTLTLRSPRGDRLVGR